MVDFLKDNLSSAMLPASLMRIELNVQPSLILKCNLTSELAMSYKIHNAVPTFPAPAQSSAQQ